MATTGSVSATATSRGTRLLDRVERRTGITPAGLTLIAMCIGAAALGQWLGSRALFLLLYGGIATLVVAWLLGYRRLSVEAKRSDLPSRVREGRLIDVEVTVSARRGLSTVVLEEELPAAFGRPRRLAVPSLPSGDRLVHSYSFVPPLRGVYDIGPLVAEWSDPFGLTKRRAKILDATRVIVHPTTERVHDRVASRAWEDPPIRPPVSKPWPTGFEFYGLRDYVIGDDPRRIVWRAVARSMDPTEGGETRYLIWEAEQGITDEIAIILDTHEASHTDDVPSATFEAAVRTAASVGVHHLDDGFSVNLRTNGGNGADKLRGRRSQVVLLDRLAEAELEEAPLEESLELLFVRSNRARHNVIVTPHLDQRAAARLRLAVEHGASVLLVLVISDETDPMTMHRAGGLGCNVVEVRPGAPFSAAFERVVEGMRR